MRSGAANPTAKLTAIIGGMAAGADSIDDLDVIRSGGMKSLFGGVHAAPTLGIFLREFTHGHNRQLAAVLRRHLVALVARTPVLAGVEYRTFIDIDSLLRPVYGHAKLGASYGHAKIAGKNILRKGLSPLAVTISTDVAAPVLAGVRLRAGRAGSAKGAASILTEGINTAIAAGATPATILTRGDSAYGNSKTITAVVKTGALFSFTMARNPAIDAAISSIGDDAYIPVHYPGAVLDPDTGELISDAQVAEVPYTAFAGTRYQITARLIVRRVLDANTQDPLFPVWRHHPFFTTNTEPVAQADITHRRHAICETVWSDLIDGPWALRVPKTSSALVTAGLIIANDLAPGLPYAAHGITDVSWAMMPYCAASTGLPRRDQRARVGATATDERPCEGRRNPGPTPPDHRPATTTARREGPVHSG